MKKVAFKMKLNLGEKDEYIRRHDLIWPELKALLKNSGVVDYTIFLDEETDTLFAVQKNIGGKNFQEISDNEIVKSGGNIWLI